MSQVKGFVESGSLPAQHCHESERVRLVGVNPPAREQDFHRPGVTEAEGQEVRAPSLNRDATVDEWELQERARRGHHQVAMKQQSRPDADGRSLHRNNEWSVESVQRFQEANHRTVRRLRPVGCKLGEVVAGAESLTLAGKDQDASVGLGPDQTE